MLRVRMSREGRRPVELYRLTGTRKRRGAERVVADPGRSATGRYTFTVAKTARDNVRLSVKYSAPVPTVVFAGDVPHA